MIRQYSGDDVALAKRARSVSFPHSKSTERFDAGFDDLARNFCIAEHEQV